MRRFDTPYIADWFAISMRWLALVGIILLLGLARSLTLNLMWPLAGLIVWNLAMTTLAALSVRLSYHRVFSFIMDVLLSGAFFWVQGGLDGPAKWVGFLPIMTGAVYFEFLGGLLAAVCMALLTLFKFESFSSVTFDLNSKAFPYIGILLGSGVIIGFIGRVLAGRLRKSRSRYLKQRIKGAASKMNVCAPYMN